MSDTLEHPDSYPAEERSFTTLSPEFDGRFPIYTETIFPGMDADSFEKRVEYAQPEVVLLITNANGTVPTNLHETIGRITENSTLVFALPDRQNPFTDQTPTYYGVVETHDAPQLGYLENGGLFLEKASVAQHYQVMESVVKMLNNGLKGDKLKNAITAEYRFGDGEEPPTYDDAARIRNLEAMQERLQETGNDLDEFSQHALDNARKRVAENN